MEKRTTCPNNNKYYIMTKNGGWNNAIQGKPTKTGANVLANCVGYANGRFAEIQKTQGIKYQLVCNAENFITKAKSYGLKTSNTPVLGGIMVWEGKGSLAGHVAIVEDIYNSNEIFTSESCYNGSAFYNKVRDNKNGRWGMSANYKFIGCIVNPANPQPTPTPSGDKNIKYLQAKLNERYNTGLVVDGIYGSATKKGLIIGLQKEDNWQYGAGLVVDGIMGNNTARKSPVIRKGADGWITWNIQCMLYCKGYYKGTLDGKYGDQTGIAIKNFQKSVGLTADGIVGYNTYMKLYS